MRAGEDVAKKLIAKKRKTRDKTISQDNKICKLRISAQKAYNTLHSQLNTIDSQKLTKAKQILQEEYYIFFKIDEYTLWKEKLTND